MIEKIAEDFSPDVLPMLIEANGIESFRSWGAWSGLDMHEDDLTLWTLSDVPFPLFNNVLRATIPPDRVKSSIEAVLDRAGRRGVPMAWWTGPSTQPADLGDHLEAAGFVGDVPAGMAIDLLSLAEQSAMPPGLTIEEVRNERDLQTWCDVLGPVYGFPDFATEAWFQMYAAVGFGPQTPWRHFLGQLDQEAVATSSLFMGVGVAGVSSVAVAPSVRKQGIGSAVTTAALSQAKRSGYRIGTLFSSEEAQSMYGRLGFRQYCQGGCYLWMEGDYPG